MADEKDKLNGFGPGDIFKLLYLILRQIGKPLDINPKALLDFPQNAKINVSIVDGKLRIFAPVKRERQILTPTRKLIKPKIKETNNGRGRGKGTKWTR